MHTRPPHAGGILFSLYGRFRSTELATATAVEGEVSGLPFERAEEAGKGRALRALRALETERSPKPSLQSPRSERLFLSYRVASDAALVEAIYDKLRAKGVDVWWDKISLPPGKRWEEGFADGLASSSIFVPFLSKVGGCTFQVPAHCTSMHPLMHPLVPLALEGGTCAVWRVEGRFELR